MRNRMDGNDETARIRTADETSRKEPNEVNLLDLAGGILRQRATVWACALVVTVVVVLVSIVAPRTWTANASFVPQTARDPARSGLASLAGQFGVQIPAGDGGQTPQFYARLVKSREILGALAADTFFVADTLALFSDGLVSGTIADLRGFDEGRVELDQDAATRWLRDEVMSSSTNLATGLVEVAVVTHWPDLSEQVLRRTLELINVFNLETRQSQAAAERRFIETRVAESRDSLLEAEGDLQRFLQSNRSFQASPELQFEHDRLQRDVALRQQVYSSLVQSYEEARISEVRNTPVISLIERPEKPVKPDPRRIVLKAIVGFILGAVFGIFLAMIREFARRQRILGTEAYREFSSLWTDTKTDLKRTLRWSKSRTE